MIRKLLLLTVATLLAVAAQAETPAEQLGWQMAIHERTFKDFTIFECIDKTAQLSLHYMSLSASVKLDEGKGVPLAKLTDNQVASIKKHLAEKQITLVN